MIFSRHHSYFCIFFQKLTNIDTDFNSLSVKNDTKLINISIILVEHPIN